MCGIFGIITNQPRKLDKRTFCVLGVNNDSRGGDSCGIFIDGNVEYGVDEHKMFWKFFPKSKLLGSTSKCQIALGHCRKASVGAVTAENAQPVVIRNAEGKIEFVLIHNGTIANYVDLGRKYLPDKNVYGMTDSQVMAHIFYQKGYSVLGEYIGAGAFVMVDYRGDTPKILMFKGKSKLTASSASPQEERPLYCVYNEHEFIFSSIIDYLPALRPEYETKTLLSNKLVELSDGELYIVGEYDREKLWQTREQYSSYHNTYTYPNNLTYPKKTDNLLSGCIYGNTEDSYHWEDVIDLTGTGIYLIGGAPAHGLYWTDAIGNIEDKKKTGTIQASFWNGVLLNNSQCFFFLSKFCTELGASKEELLEMFPDLVHYLSPVACWQTERGYWVTSDSPDSHFRYSGTAKFPFTTSEIQVKKGRVVMETENIPYRDSISPLLLAVDYKVDPKIVESIN